MSVCHATSPSIIPPALTVCHSTHPYITLSVCHTGMSICHTTHQSNCQSTHKSVALSIPNMASLSVIPVRPSYDQSIHHPVNSSMTHQSVTPPVSPTIRQTVNLCPTICTPSYLFSHAVLHRLTIHPPYTPVHQTVRHHLRDSTFPRPLLPQSRGPLPSEMNV